MPKTEKKFLDTVYDVAGADGIGSLYDDWAASYDAELAENGYATPGRVARAMARTGCRGPVLDIGCGTGLSGAALRRAGFDVIDGTDLSAGMLDEARAKAIYRKLWVTDPATSLPNGYATIAAIGVVSPGAAPAALLADIFAALPSGGRLAFSFNDHALEDAAYTGALARVLDAGGPLLFKEHGPHIPERDLCSTVYVIEKA